LWKNQFRSISDQVVEMILSRGQTTIFIHERLHELKRFEWYAHCTKNNSGIETWYAQSDSVIRKPMANIILGDLAADYDRVDHINGITLDNRDVNLVAANAKTNANNLKLYINNTSGRNGVVTLKNHGNLYFVARWTENQKAKAGLWHRYFEDDETSLHAAYEAACRDRDDADRKIECLNGKRPKHTALERL
jgi:hypothetical protein